VLAPSSVSRLLAYCQRIAGSAACQYCDCMAHDSQCFRRLPGTGHSAPPISSLPRTVAAATKQLLVLPAPSTEVDNPWSSQISSGTDGCDTALPSAQRPYSAHMGEDDQALRTHQLAQNDGLGAPLSVDRTPADEPTDSPADRLLRKARLRINDWLLEAATPAAVLRLVSQHGASFNSVNVATALHRLARLVWPVRQPIDRHTASNQA